MVPSARQDVTSLAVGSLLAARRGESRACHRGIPSAESAILVPVD
jgi:hypothetical protein